MKIIDITGREFTNDFKEVIESKHVKLINTNDIHNINEYMRMIDYLFDNYLYKEIIIENIDGKSENDVLNMHYKMRMKSSPIIKMNKDIRDMSLEKFCVVDDESMTIDFEHIVNFDNSFIDTIIKYVDEYGIDTFHMKGSNLDKYLENVDFFCGMVKKYNNNINVVVDIHNLHIVNEQFVYWCNNNNIKLNLFIDEFEVLQIPVFKSIIHKDFYIKYKFEEETKKTAVILRETFTQDIYVIINKHIDVKDIYTLTDLLDTLSKIYVDMDEWLYLDISELDEQESYLVEKMVGAYL